MTLDERKAEAVAKAHTAFILNPSLDAVVFPDSNVILLDTEAGFNGMMDEEMAAKFGAQA
jgi:hypothetical protein